MKKKLKLIRITTVPVSLDKLLNGQLRYMNQFYEVIGISSDSEYLKKVGAKEGIETFSLEMTRKITPFLDLAAVIRLYFYLKRTSAFIVHTHTPKAGLVGMLAARLAGVPCRLHTVAGLPLMESKGLKRKLLHWVEKLTYSCATKVYPNSNGLLEIINQNRFCAPNKLMVLANGSSNGIDTSYFTPTAVSVSQKKIVQQELSIEATDFVYIFVGRLVKDKGINELVEAFVSLSAITPAIKLLLVGPFEPDLDPLSPSTIAYITEHPNIISVGFQSDVRPYFAISNALVFPSYREGFPNVVMQAGAMGLPCIVTDINGCNEIVVAGENGIIIPVKNVDALQEAMSRLLDLGCYSSLQEKAREMITSRYEQHLIWEALLEEYKQLV